MSWIYCAHLMTAHPHLRRAIVCAAMLVASAAVAHAQPVFVARVAVKDRATFRYFQFFQQRGDWVLPDIGYIDYGDAAYYELFAGFGRMLRKSPKLNVLGELYYLQAGGTASAGEKYVLPWVLVAFSASPRIRGEAVYFPYLPLTDSATLQHVVERAKLEYSWRYLKLGGGYGAYQRHGSDWQHMPFATATVSPPIVGDLEFWVQRVHQGGVQVQFRYFRVFK